MATLPISKPMVAPEYEGIARVAQAALVATGYRSLAALDCRFTDGVIVISGTVDSFYLKQLAQESIRQSGSGHPIHNTIEVRPY